MINKIIHFYLISIQIRRFSASAYEVSVTRKESKPIFQNELNGNVKNKEKLICIIKLSFI